MKLWEKKEWERESFRFLIYKRLNDKRFFAINKRQILVLHVVSNSVDQLKQNFKKHNL